MVNACKLCEMMPMASRGFIAAQRTMPDVSRMAHATLCSERGWQTATHRLVRALCPHLRVLLLKRQHTVKSISGAHRHGVHILEYSLLNLGGDADVATRRQRRLICVQPGLEPHA
eukprot:scaffold228728_cov32-Tisochrysis_lutea.AAC.1